MARNILPDRQALAELCRASPHPPARLVRLELKETAGPDSDVPPRTRGLLVEFEADATPTFLDMAQIDLDLSALLGGRKVDLRTRDDLSRYFREEMVQTAEVQYAAP